MIQRVRILLADDHAVLRSGLRLLLDGRDDMKVVGEAANGAELLPLAH
jgi:DNA-binding NarL/FixJ family response regulator